MVIRDKIISLCINEEIKQYNIEKQKNNEKIYYVAYMHIVKKIVKLLKELYITNPLEIKIIYEYLLYNGYFSIDKKFKFSTNDRKLNVHIPGADIIRGNGVCINISDLLKEIYNMYGFNSHVVTCSLEPTKTPSKYTPNIKRNVGKVDLGKPNFFNAYLLKKYVGNHAITLVNYNNKSYLCDPSSLDFVSLKKNNNGEYLFHDIKTTLLPEYFGILENKVNELNRLLKFTTKLDSKEIIDFYEKVIHSCELNKYTFNKFHESIKNDIDIVCKTLK